MLSYKGNATRVMCNNFCDKTVDRAKEWFRNNKTEPYCYWAKDEFIHIKDKCNKEVLDKHPEIEDIDDHTIVQFNSEMNIVRLSRFCPKLREGLEDMYKNGVVNGFGENTHWVLFEDRDNYELLLFHKE